MKRVMIIGAPGSGKSTAAQMIGAALDLPVYHMDREVYWLPNWQERPPAERPEIIAKIVARDTWVLDGSYSSTYAMRGARAEMLIWLATPLPKRLLRVVRRTLRDRGQPRTDLAPGCEEQVRMLPGFLWFILSSHRRNKRKAGHFFDGFQGEKHRFTSAAAVNGFVARLSASASPL